MSDILEIRMQTHEVECSICGDWTAHQWSVPTYNGDLVSNDFPDELIREGGGNMAVCEHCYDRHAADDMETFDSFYLWRLEGLDAGAGI